MYKLSFHPDVYKDIEQINLLDSAAVARFHVFFTEVKDNPEILLNTLDNIEENDLIFNKVVNLQPWETMKKSGRSLWRIRFSDFAYRKPDYRIIYFISETLKKITITAILKREEIDYDNLDNPICRRIADAYDQYFS